MKQPIVTSRQVRQLVGMYCYPLEVFCNIVGLHKDEFGYISLTELKSIKGSFSRFEI